jgi:hypothetical protein
VYTDINILLLGTEDTIDLSQEITLKEILPMHTYNGSVVYTVNSEEDILKGSPSFAMAAKIKNGDIVTITYQEQSIQKKFLVDENIRGSIGLYPILPNKQDNKIVSGYRFKQVKIQKVDL